MSTHLEIARQALASHLKELGFDAASIKMTTEKDLCFRATWIVEPDSQKALCSAEAVISFALGFGPKKEDVQFAPGQYHPKLNSPGRSNEGLAKAILPFAKKKCLCLHNGKWLKH